LLIAPGAGHGYMCAARGDYHPDAAAAGWSALLELLAGSL
jgi:carboxymethylenebutenolidase